MAEPLVLLGGTFDPPHLGHLLLGECARVQFEAERVVYLPAGDPYRKSGTQPGRLQPGQEGRVVSSAEHRLAMLELAIAGNPHFAIDDRETRRDGPTYTVDTLEELHAEGQDNIILVLGSDAVADMPNWKAPDRIRELARIAVVPKSPEFERPVPQPSTPRESAGIENGKSKIEPGFVDMPYLPISSTLIRTRVAAGQPVRYLLPDPVWQYVQEHRLYQPL